MSFLFAYSLLLTIAVDDFRTCLGADPNSFMSALGDPGMMNNDARFAVEAWNACNEVGKEAADMGSPRMADCADLDCSHMVGFSSNTCEVLQKVSDGVNRLTVGDPFPGNSSFRPSKDVNNYAAEKEIYLGSLCQKNDSNEPWYFWMIMLKNGNLNVNDTNVCPKYGRKLVNATNVTWGKSFPCFGNGCMNQPLMFRNQSRIDDLNKHSSLTGMFYGSYDLDSNVTSNNSTAPSNMSYFSVTWQKIASTIESSSWILSFKLTTSDKYPWLSMFLRADAAEGRNAGYHYEGRGIMEMDKLPTSPNFNVTMNLHLIKGGGPSDQFYLTDLGACWKNNGDRCDGDVTTDVTRHVQMIINPDTTVTCTQDNLRACPPYHKNTTTGVKINKTDVNNFPYEAYHLYCAPGNATFNETEIDKCDPFTDSQQQELLQILPHLEWSKFGYPKTKEAVNWEGDAKTWILDAGKLTDGMYFYQDPNTTKLPVRTWTSINVGAEMYNLNSSGAQTTAEWTVSDFDVLVHDKT